MEKVSRAVFETLALLKPYDIDVEKVRYGNDRDGCYILADLPDRSDIISFGISNDVGFERDMAAQGRKVFLHDHTIDTLPEQNPLFDFRKTGVCADGQSGGGLITLAESLAAISDCSKRLILKMDVEGAEWGVFATTPRAILERFDQIVVEMHWLGNLRDSTFCSTVNTALSRLNEQFTLFHVHGNNCRELEIVDGFTVADVIEVSYVRTSLITRRKSQTVYPTSMNKSNHPDHHDLPLLFFPFLPMSVDFDKVSEVAGRVDLEQKFYGGRSA